MKADTIIYKFNDSSVPPQYHRSYEIIITKTEAKIVVDSYGDIINESKVELKDGQFAEVLRTIKEAKITAASNAGFEDEKTGGTSEYLEISVNQSEIIDGEVNHCIKKDFGEISGDLESLSAKLKSLFPDFEKLLKR